MDAQSNIAASAQFGLWAVLRIILPIAIGWMVLVATRGQYYFDVFGPLVWTLFIFHLGATFAFRCSHILDTAAFLFLIFASGSAANISVYNQFSQSAAWTTVALAFALYAIVSFIGRLSTRNQLARRSVRLPHVLTAVSILFVAVAVCSTSKTMVGFLLIPGCLFIPVILFWSFVTPKRDPE